MIARGEQSAATLLKEAVQLHPNDHIAHFNLGGAYVQQKNLRLAVVHDAASSRIPWETLRLGDKTPALGAGLSHRYEADDLSIAKWLDATMTGRGVTVK